MARKTGRSLFAIVFMLFGQIASAGAQTPSCPGDIAVWLNTKTGVYHLPNSRWYGATKHGTYICRKAADAEGDRAAENGQ